MEQKEKIIKDAQFRKGSSIAYFNATNAAIEILKLKNDKENIKENLVEIRDWLIDEYTKYYEEVIAPIGGTYNTKDIIERIQSYKTADELKEYFFKFIPMEARQNPAILIAVKEKKQALSSIQI